MRAFTAEEKQDIWGGFKNGMTYLDLLALYKGMTQADLFDVLNEMEEKEPYDKRKVKDLLGKKYNDLPKDVKNKIFEELGGRAPDIEEIAHKYNANFLDIEELYNLKFAKNRNFYTHRAEIKKKYFSGETLRDINKLYDFVTREMLDSLDREAIYEDFRAGMTLSELLRTWGKTAMDDLTFSGEIETGKRYSRDKILLIILNGIVKEQASTRGAKT